MPLFYMVLAAVFKSTGVLPANGFGGLEPGAATTISMAMLAAGVTSCMASIAVKKFLAQGRPGASQDEQAVRFKGTLAAIAVSESGAVLGLVIMLLTGNLVYGGLLCGLSIAVSLFHFPSRYWLEHGDKVM